MYKQYNNTFLDYNGLFSDKAKSLSDIKSHKIYEKWDKEDFELLEEFADWLNIYKHNTSELNSASPFMYLNLSIKNWKSYDGNGAPFINIFKEYFNLKDSPIKRLLPLTFTMFKKEFSILENVLSKDKSGELIKVSSILSLIWSKLKKNWKNVAKEIADTYFENPLSYMNLNNIEKRFVLSSYVDLYVLFKNLSLYRVRKSIIGNLKKKGTKSIRQVLNIGSTYIDRVSFFYLSVETDDKTIKINNKEYEIVKLQGEDTKRIVIEDANELREVNEKIKSMNMLNIKDVKLGKLRTLVHHLNDYQSGMSIDHQNVTKALWRIEDDGLDDYLWTGATRRIEAIKEEIFKILNAKDDSLQDIKRLISSIISSVYSYVDDVNDQDAFLRAWFNLELIANSFKGGSFNERVSNAINTVAKYYNDKISSSIVKEIIIYRNTLIHGGNADGVRIGTYNALLNFVISYVLVYIVENISFLEEISLTKLISTIEHSNNML